MKLYNSLTRKKHVFRPLDEKKVKMYVCGITPYDTTHLGHAFVYTFFDTLKRYLEFKKFKVEYTQNVTDIDDDILKRAKKVGQNWQELGSFWTNKFLKDISDLHIQLPTHYVKATDSIDVIIQIVRTLEQKQLAYEKNGNVYFSVDHYTQYGQLSKYSTDEMLRLSKERGANPEDPNKQNPLDFILWQRSLLDEPYWESPWGKGRPGWHIECSAMIRETLGDQIDIHGGGFDLIYPHHESEIAQSECATGKEPFVNFWMHVAMLSYQGEKMSKSLGNLVLVSDLLKKYSANQVRFLLLSHHYREPWEFTFDELESKCHELENIEKAARLISNHKVKNTQWTHIKKQFFRALDNDMDTSKAVTALQSLASIANSTGEIDGYQFRQLATLLGLVL